MCSNVLNQQLTYATWMRKSDFLSKLDIEKEQGVRITRQLTSNRALQKALENPEVKNAIMDVIESSIEEILANQKKVEL